MRTLKKSHKLDAVCYDIRGPVHREARRLEEDGHKILKLNIGNPAPFGFDAPEEIVQDMIHNVPVSQGYSDSRGLFSGRKAVMQYCQQKGIKNVEIDDVYLGTLQRMGCRTSEGRRNQTHATCSTRNDGDGG